MPSERSFRTKIPYGLKPITGVLENLKEDGPQQGLHRRFFPRRSKARRR